MRDTLGMRMIAETTRFPISRDDAMGDAREGVPWDELLVHGKFVRSLSLALVEDASLAEDVAQATWLAAAEHPPADRGRVVGWLRTVATNFARQWRRSDSRRRGREVTAALGEVLPSTESIAARLETQRIVVECVRALEDDYRTAIVLRFLDELPAEEVARRLGVPLETARTRVKRGIEQLRRSLARRFGPEPDDWMAALAPLTRMVGVPRSATAPIAFGSGRLPGFAGLGSKSGAVVLAASLVVIGGSVVWWSNRNRKSDAAGVANRDSAESLIRPGPPKTDEPDTASRLAESAASNSSPDSESKRSGTSIVGSIRGIAVDYDHDHVPIPHAILLVAPWNSHEWGAVTGLVARARALSMQSDPDRHGVFLVTADAKGEFESPILDRNEGWSVVGIDGTTRVGAPTEIPSGDAARSEPMEVFIGDTTEVLGSVAAESGEALPDAQVRMNSSLPGRMLDDEAIPIDDGARFRLVMPIFRHASFEATAAGRMGARKVLSHFKNTQHSLRVDLVLAPALEVHGRFVDGDRAPARIRETLLPRLPQVDRTLDVPSGVVVASLKDDWDFRPGAIVPDEIDSTGVIHIDDDTWSIPVTAASTRIALVARRTIVGWFEFDGAKVAPDSRLEVPMLVDPRLLPSSGEPCTVHVKVVDAAGQAVHCPAGNVYLEDDHSRPMSLLARRDDRLARDGEIDFLEVPFGTWTVQKQTDGEQAFEVPEFRLDATHVHSDIEVRAIGPRDPPNCARLRLSFTRGDGSPLFSKNSPSSSWPVRDVRLYRRDGGEMRAAAWVESANDPDSGTKSLKVPRGEYVVVASLPASGEGQGLANGWCRADVTGGDVDVAIAFSAGAVVRIRAAPELKLPDEPIGFQLRILNEAGVPIVDWMHPEYGQGSDERETDIRLEAGRYRATVFLPQHESASATFDVPADELVTIPMRLSRR